MAKVFRLFQDKNLQHWEDRGEAYGPSVIEKIPNSDGDQSKNEPTSIPSPFARIDLVRTAFKYAVDKNQLDDKTIYHKLISDCFDVGEMFFKINSLGNKAQIKSWDRIHDLNKLKNSSNPKHKLYGETLDLFLKEDNDTYNFDLLNKIYFLFYDFQIIGGTSPSTLFFTSGNDLKFNKIQFGNAILFKDIRPLYKRDPEYQKYLHHFFKAYPELSYKMRDLSAYLDKNLKMLFNTNKNLHNEIQQLENKSAEVLKQDLNLTYESIDTGTAGDNLEIIGYWMKKKRTKDRGNEIEENSDFVIKSSKYAGGHKPLVLQNNWTEKLYYTDKSVLWESTIKVPYYNEETNINNRILPEQLDKYPYLIVSDFLQSHIIRLIYPINKDKYWNGNISFEPGADKNKHFLLPITPKFFDFFDTTDLQSQMPDGNPMFQMTVYPNSIVVELRIPIKGNSNYITFKRTYDNKTAINREANQIVNKGIISENQFGLTLYPFVKTGDDLNSFYRIMLVDKDISPETKHFNYDLAFHKNYKNELLIYKAKKIRSKNNETYQSSFFIVEKEFDYIEVKSNNVSGIIIPLFPAVQNGTQEFTFAIDFGTTNTHIEYTLDYMKNSKLRVIVPFEINKNDIQIATLHDPNSTEVVEEITGDIYIFQLIPQEFVPEIIGGQSDFRFPQRTILGYHESVDTSKPTYSLADFNIPFVFEKRLMFRETKVKTNLKWSNYTMSDDEEIKVKAFFEELIFLIRNKVLMNNGSLKETKLIWFYPSSMVEERRNKLEAIWIFLFNKYITDKRIPIKISESIAPFYYFKNKGGIDASHLPVASIDIGGGTTDIVVYKDNEPKTLTSFRFAANSIFGDAYNGSPERNGFIVKHLKKIRTKLVKNELNDLVRILDSIYNEQNSEDIIAFLFSLEDNKEILDRKVPISFNHMLKKDGDLKIVFIVFYSALIYHLAKLMEAKKYEIPRYLTFSGTGSKILSIADDNIELEGLQELTNIIFQKVYNTRESNIGLVQNEKPKEITSRGGLHSDMDVDIENIKSVLIGDKENTLISENKITYKELDDKKLLESIIEEVNEFIDMLFSINNDFNFNKKFGVNPANLDNNIKTLKEDLMQFLKSGIQIKLQDLRGNTNINLEEPLFFYPLIGALNKLAFNV